MEFVTVNYKMKKQPFILIGAPHYLDKALIDSIETKMKTKYNISNILLSHIMPKYSMNDLLTLNDDEIEIICRRIIIASMTDKVILNTDYMKSLTRISLIFEKIKNGEGVCYKI